MGLIHSDKKSAVHLIELLICEGIRDFIISPGSRNAPLINELVHRKTKGIRLYSIIDERSAAFYALGMALKTHRPVVVVCTSGSALLNYLPAVSEAFYQQVPLIVISADRPYYRIDTGEGQTIRQQGALKNFLRGEMNIPLDEEQDNYPGLDGEINKIIRLSSNPSPGPVHINIEFEEPLYQQTNQIDLTTIQSNINHTNSVSNTPLIKQNIEVFDSTPKIMFLCGQMQQNKELEGLLIEFSERANCIVLCETTANLNQPGFVSSIDKTILTFGEENADFAPDLLISLGNAIISKIVKRYLRKHKPTFQWQIAPGGVFQDTFDGLSLRLTADPTAFLKDLLVKTRATTSDYREKWLTQFNLSKTIHKKYLESIPFSDLIIFDYLLKNIPANSDLHLSNSSAIRYQQLFDNNNELISYCNRGTSGIDGCTSTAAGFALKNPKETWLITGDISFLYDSNALLTNYSPGLKIILINNGGGNIFRIIPGPSDIPEFETYFEATVQVDIRALCRAFNVAYYQANNQQELKNNFEKLNDSTGISVLEIKSPGALSATILRNYFNALKENKHEYNTKVENH